MEQDDPAYRSCSCSLSLRRSSAIQIARPMTRDFFSIWPRSISISISPAAEATSANFIVSGPDWIADPWQGLN
jgi:hypothetical protein